jgi:hypothetical protein
MTIIQFVTAHHQHLRTLSNACLNYVINYVVQHANVDPLICSGVSYSTKVWHAFVLLSVVFAIDC